MSVCNEHELELAAKSTASIEMKTPNLQPDLSALGAHTSGHRQRSQVSTFRNTATNTCLLPVNLWTLCINHIFDQHVLKRRSNKGLHRITGNSSTLVQFGQPTPTHRACTEFEACASRLRKLPLWPWLQVKYLSKDNIAIAASISPCALPYIAMHAKCLHLECVQLPAWL